MKKANGLYEKYLSPMSLIKLKSGNLRAMGGFNLP